MEEVFTHQNLLALEISSKDSIDFYTDKDSNSDRKNLLQLRRTKLSLDSSYNLPKLMSSDSHNLIKLGTNAEGENRLTRIKVDELNYQSFKIALLSHESRIRLENFIPEKRPIIKSLKIYGGLLDEVEINLNRNLTCIIGSRGAGKSTLLETIRVATGNDTRSKLVDSEVWPQEIYLTFEDESGQQIDFKREKFNDIQNLTDPVNGIHKIDIESYGQGETASTIQHSDDNPMVLINFLDSFLEDIESFKSQDKELVEKLLANQSNARKLRLELLSLPETKKALLNENKKLTNLKKEKAGDLVKFQNALIKERQIRKSIIDDLKNLISTYREILNDNSIFEGFESLTDEEIIVGKDYFKRVKELVSDFSSIVQNKSSELNNELNKKIEDLKTELNSWKEQEKVYQEKIDKKKEELTKQGIPFDLGKINQISKDIIELDKRVKKLESYKKELKKLIEDRIELVNSRKQIKDKIYFTRVSFAQTVNENLKNTLDGLFITVQLKQGKYSPNFENQLKSLMDWRTSQVPKAKLVSEQMTPIEFVDVIKKKDITKLENLKDLEGKQLLTKKECEALISRANNENSYEEFESLNFEDLPSILVTKLYKDSDGKTQRITRSISQLSLGQQQSVLLGILMLSKSKKPLIIDQPEDNLDSEFIFKTIVKNLRKIKESRQVIIVTHNPNIAVLGDAELIIPLKSTNIKSHVLNAGSIDRNATRQICCEILEGGQSAFKQRKQIYGI